jgi:hypothetical protein
MGKRVDFDRDRLASLVGSMSQKTKDEISLLKNQLVEVYARVNIQVSCVISTILTDCSNDLVVY